MNRLPCGWALVLLAATATSAQEPPVVVCPTGDPDACVAVDPTQMPPLLPPQHEHVVGAPDPLRSGQAWLGWTASSPPADPGLALPGTCARTAERARARFVDAMASGDLNRLLAVYQWRGRTDEQATPLIEQLMAVAAQGHWERSEVSMWVGSSDTPAHVPTHWRWMADADSRAWHFAMRPVNGCWFVEFQAPPALALSTGPGGETPSSDAPPTAVNPENPDELVF